MGQLHHSNLFVQFALDITRGLLTFYIWSIYAKDHIVVEVFKNCHTTDWDAILSVITWKKLKVSTFWLSHLSQQTTIV